MPTDDHQKHYYPWTYIADYMGSSNRQTASFDIDSKVWKITWSAGPDYGNKGKFVIRIMTDGGSQVAEMGGETPLTGDSSFIRRSGRFYLDITSQDYSYTLMVQKRRF